MIELSKPDFDALDKAVSLYRSFFIDAEKDNYPFKNHPLGENPFDTKINNLLPSVEGFYDLLNDYANGKYSGHEGTIYYYLVYTTREYHKSYQDIKYSKDNQYHKIQGLHQLYELCKALNETSRLDEARQKSSIRIGWSKMFEMPLFQSITIDLSLLGEEYFGLDSPLKITGKEALKEIESALRKHYHGLDSDFKSNDNFGFREFIYSSKDQMQLAKRNEYKAITSNQAFHHSILKPLSISLYQLLKDLHIDSEHLALQPKEIGRLIFDLYEYFRIPLPSVPDDHYKRQRRPPESDKDLYDRYIRDLEKRKKKIVYRSVNEKEAIKMFGDWYRNSIKK